jgi:hypothetical protein
MRCRRSSRRPRCPPPGWVCATRRRCCRSPTGASTTTSGLECFQAWNSGSPTSAESADFLIVANAGGMLTRTSHPYGGVRGLWRAKDVQYSQTTKLRVPGTSTSCSPAPPRHLRRRYDGALSTKLVAPLARLGPTSIGSYQRRPASSRTTRTGRRTRGSPRATPSLRSARCHGASTLPSHRRRSAVFGGSLSTARGESACRGA